MREQLTPEGITVLVGTIVLFWIMVAALVRRHARGVRRISTGDTRA